MIIYLLIMLLLGMMIAAFVSGEISVGITCIVIIVILSIIGITKRYFKEKSMYYNSNKPSAWNYINKVKALQNNPDITLIFTPSEITNALVNLLDARSNLDEEEYGMVISLYKIYDNTNQNLYLNFSDYLSYGMTIMSTFDLIAPYYKFCGKSDTSLLEEIDYQKLPYRIKAKQIFNDIPFNEEEFERLLSEFRMEFYNA